MSTSLKRRSLSKPRNGERIALYDLAFVRSRNRNKVHSLLLEEFDKSGLSKAEVAKMLGKRPEQITRWLSGPGNLTLDTISDLIFAIRGRFFTLKLNDDLSKGRSNQNSPEWLAFHTAGPGWVAVRGDKNDSKFESIESKYEGYSIKLSGTSSDEGKKYV